MVGLVGEKVKRATVGAEVGKSSAVKVTDVGVLFTRVTFFSADNAPVLVSRALNMTSAWGVGAVPLTKTLALDSGSVSVNDPVCPDSTWPTELPFANACSGLAVRLTTRTGKSDSYRPVQPEAAIAQATTAAVERMTRERIMAGVLGRARNASGPLFAN